jgi:tetratricopeptide (TPR) repeat protein
MHAAGADGKGPSPKSGGMKGFLTLVLATILGAFALAQVASDGVFNAAAAKISVPRLVPHAAGVALYARLAEQPFAPALTKRVAAAAAIRDNRLGDAQRLIALVPPGPERDDLAGRLLEARGEREAAVEHFVAAGDLIRVSSTVDALDRAGDVARAIRVQQRLLAKLQQLGDPIGVAHAYWRLGQLQSEVRDHRAAARDYAAAVALEPLSETFLLGAANEALVYGRLATAGKYFERAVAIDPNSLDAHVGVGRVAARTGEVARARREAAFVRARDPSWHDLPVLNCEIAHERAC